MTTPLSARLARGRDRRAGIGVSRKARTLLAGILASIIALGTWAAAVSPSEAHAADAATPPPWSAAAAAPAISSAAISPSEVHAADAAAPTGRLIVTWRDGFHVASIGAVTVQIPNPRRSVVTAAPGAAAALAERLRARPDIASVVPDSVLHIADWPASGAPNDPYYTTYQADLPLMHVPDAWRTTTGTASTIVAILDTGYAASHPDLAGVPIVAPFNEITGTTDVTDANGHGTHLTGTIAARANNGLGVAGIAPGVSIMPVKVCGDDGTCWNSDVLAGVDYAVAHGASVINVSLGAPLSAAGIAAFQSTYDRAAAAGVIVVAAAGNSGDGTIEYPAAFNHVISVAATDDATASPDAIASFSTHNSFVDVAAPGVDIVSTLRTGAYGYMSGTSMAAPHVAAVAALVRSAHPGWTVAQVESAIEQTAVDLGAPGRDDSFGYGRVDAAAAVGGGGTPIPAPSPIATPAPSQAPDVSPSPAPSQAPDVSPSPVPSPTPDPAASPTPTPDPGASPTPTPDPGGSPTPTPIGSPTPIGPPPAPVVSPTPASPRVASVTPRTASTSVGRSFHPRVSFSVPVTGVSIQTVLLTDLSRGTSVSIRVTYSAVTQTATLIPSARLSANHRYRITVTRGVAARDGGRRLAVTFGAIFRTGPR